MDLSNSAGGQEPREDDLLFDATWSNAHLCSEIPAKVTSNPALLLYHLLSLFTEVPIDWIYLRILPNQGIYFYTEVHSYFPFVKLLLARVDFTSFYLDEGLANLFTQGYLLKLSIDALLYALIIPPERAPTGVRFTLTKKKFSFHWYYIEKEGRNEVDERYLPLRRVYRYRAWQVAPTSPPPPVRKEVPCIGVPIPTGGARNALAIYAIHSTHNYDLSCECDVQAFKEQLAATVRWCKRHPRPDPRNSQYYSFPPVIYYYGVLHYFPQEPELLIYPARHDYGVQEARLEFTPLHPDNIAITGTPPTKEFVTIIELVPVLRLISFIRRYLPLHSFMLKLDIDPASFPFHFQVTPSSYFEFYIGSFTGPPYPQ